MNEPWRPWADATWWFFACGVITLLAGIYGGLVMALKNRVDLSGTAMLVSLVFFIILLVASGICDAKRYNLELQASHTRERCIWEQENVNGMGI